MLNYPLEIIIIYLFDDQLTFICLGTYLLIIVLIIINVEKVYVETFHDFMMILSFFLSFFLNQSMLFNIYLKLTQQKKLILTLIVRRHICI